MSRSAIIEKLESQQLKKDLPAFRVGDSVKVHLRIIEGEKERTQVFAGIVIARKHSGLSETFSVYRVAYGSGMERVFLLHSPRISKIEVTKEGDVRRSKLYYLRGKSGKATRVKALIRPRKKLEAAKPAAQAPVETQTEEVSSEA